MFISGLLFGLAPLAVYGAYRAAQFAKSNNTALNEIKEAHRRIDCLADDVRQLNINSAQEDETNQRFHNLERRLTSIENQLEEITAHMNYIEDRVSKAKMKK